VDDFDITAASRGGLLEAACTENGLDFTPFGVVHAAPEHPNAECFYGTRHRDMLVA
jgi:hypothetical protein